MRDESRFSTWDAKLSAARKKILSAIKRSFGKVLGLHAKDTIDTIMALYNKVKC